VYDSAAESGDDVPQQPGRPAVVPQVLDDRQVAHRSATHSTRGRATAQPGQDGPQTGTQGRRGIHIRLELTVEGRLIVDRTTDADAASVQ